MEPRRCIVDWRGVPDLTKRADFYSVFWSHKNRPTLGNPNGRILVAISATLLYHGPGPAMRPYNLDLYQAALKRNALTERVAWTGEDEWHSRVFDLTKRGMLQDWLAILAEHFPWADGFHVDYFSAWSWLFPDMAQSDELWDRLLAGLATGIRVQNKLCLAQQFHPSAPSMAASGQFWEVNPTSFGQTLESHESDAEMFRDAVGRVDGRETLFVSEIREPARYPAWYIEQVRAWAARNDFVLSLGRDATSVGAA